MVPKTTSSAESMLGGTPKRGAGVPPPSRVPRIDAATLDAQRQLWSLQGRANTWFCGSYFGSGFHEDAIQAGLAVGESLGGVKRPWTVAGESDRIDVHAATRPPQPR